MEAQVQEISSLIQQNRELSHQHMLQVGQGHHASATAMDAGVNAGGGALLSGTFDEDESAASFQEALRAFREAGKPAPAPRPATAQAAAAPTSTRDARAARHAREAYDRARHALSARAETLEAEIGQLEQRMIAKLLARNARAI